MEYTPSDVTDPTLYGEVVVFFHPTSNTAQHKPTPQIAAVSVLMPPSKHRKDAIIVFKVFDLRTKPTDDIQPITTTLLSAMQSHTRRYNIYIQHLHLVGDAEGNNVALCTYVGRRLPGSSIRQINRLFTLHNYATIEPIPDTIPRPFTHNNLTHNNLSFAIFNLIPLYPVIPCGIYNYLLDTLRAMILDHANCVPQ